MGNFKSTITNDIICREYGRLALLRVYPHLSPDRYTAKISDQVPDDVQAHWETDGYLLAVDLFYEIEVGEFTKDLDYFSKKHIQPVIDAKYPPVPE